MTERIVVPCLLDPDGTYWVAAALWEKLPKRPDGLLDVSAPLHFMPKNLKPGQFYRVPTPDRVKPSE